jgi:hypothetical protein
MTEIDVSLTLPRFVALLAAYGARLECWPEGERGAAQALLERSADARVLAREQRTMDALFSVASPTLSPELLKKLDSIPERSNGSLLARHLKVRVMWAPALGWAAVAAIGLWLGARSVDETSASDVVVESLEMDEVTPYDENELLAVFGSTVDGLEFP